MLLKRLLSNGAELKQNCKEQWLKRLADGYWKCFIAVLAVNNQLGYIQGSFAFHIGLNKHCLNCILYLLRFFI